MRWMWACAIAGLAGPQPMRIVVNIPAYRVEAYVGDSLILTMRIAVGMPRFRTPRGNFAITSIEWNPWWIPPPSPWAAKEKPTPPGRNNPMGRVKLNFRPLYFLHGTPFENSIGSAASHGCLRMRNVDAIELARLVHQFGSAQLTAEDLDGFVSDTVTTRLIDLDEPVPLEIRYDLAEVRDGKVSVYPDVYGLATRSLRDELYAVLAARGVDTLQVDSARVRRVIRSVPRSGRSIAMDSIVAPLHQRSP